MLIGTLIPDNRKGHNQYTKRKPVAKTFFLSERTKGKQKEKLTFELCTHYATEEFLVMGYGALEKRFRYFAKIYCEIHGQRTWMEDMKGNILYDTDRGDGLPEVNRVRRTSLARLPLLVSRLKTEQGRTELAKRLQEET